MGTNSLLLFMNHSYSYSVAPTTKTFSNTSICSIKAPGRLMGAEIIICLSSEPAASEKGTRTLCGFSGSINCYYYY